MPWLADIIIFFGTDSANLMLNAPKVLLMNALYASAPFFLTALAMRPRQRVSHALWGGAVFTGALWVAFALITRADTQSDKPDAGAGALWMFIIIMIWPLIVTVLMGIAAKFKEAPLEL